MKVSGSKHKNFFRSAILSDFDCDLFDFQRLKIVRKVSLQLLQVLGFLRQNKIIHADLKPENILLANSKLYHMQKKKLELVKKKKELTKSLLTPEMLFSLKQKFYQIMHNLCSQHLQNFNSVQQKLFVL